MILWPKTALPGPSTVPHAAIENMQAQYCGLAQMGEKCVLALIDGIGIADCGLPC